MSLSYTNTTILNGMAIMHLHTRHYHRKTPLFPAYRERAAAAVPGLVTNELKATVLELKERKP